MGDMGFDFDPGMYDFGGGLNFAGGDSLANLGLGDVSQFGQSFSPYDFSTGVGGMESGNWFQNYANSLGTGAGTYGTGLDYAAPGAGAPAAPQLGAPPGQQQAPPGTDWGGIAKAGLGTLGNVLGLGVSGLGMANAVRAMQQGGQQQKILNRAQEQAQQVAAPAAQAGASLTRAGEQAMLGGPLPDYLENLVEKRKAESRARIEQYLAKSGISDSTMAEQFKSWIDQQADAQRFQFAQGLLQGGYTGIGTATGPIGQSGNMAAGQMGGTDKFLREANQSLALLTGAQRGQA